MDVFGEQIGMQKNWTLLPNIEQDFKDPDKKLQEMMLEKEYIYATRKEKKKDNFFKLMKAKALYDFVAQADSNELSLKSGDILSVVRQDVGDGWWEGVSQSGQRGLFPESYVETFHQEYIYPSYQKSVVSRSSASCFNTGKISPKSRAFALKLEKNRSKINSIIDQFEKRLKLVFGIFQIWENRDFISSKSQKRLPESLPTSVERSSYHFPLLLSIAHSSIVMLFTFRWPSTERSSSPTSAAPIVSPGRSPTKKFVKPPLVKLPSANDIYRRSPDAEKKNTVLAAVLRSEALKKRRHTSASLDKQLAHLKRDYHQIIEHSVPIDPAASVGTAEPTRPDVVLDEKDELSNNGPPPTAPPPPLPEQFRQSTSLHQPSRYSTYDRRDSWNESITPSAAVGQAPESARDFDDDWSDDDEEFQSGFTSTYCGPFNKSTRVCRLMLIAQEA
uniref:SH3 domain-containing protein n=1 Tax=Romanomermis culicivorax TaxID=13658 RepID=A0A915JDY2_ROMCU